VTGAQRTSRTRLRVTRQTQDTIMAPPRTTTRPAPAPPAPSRPTPNAAAQNNGPKPPPPLASSAIAGVGAAKMPSEDHENFTPGTYLVRTRRFKHFMSAMSKGEIVIHDTEIVEVVEELEGSRRKGQTQGVAFMLNRNMYAIGELRGCISAHYPAEDTASWTVEQWVTATYAAVSAPENNAEQPLTGQYVWVHATWARPKPNAQPSDKPFCRVRYSYVTDDDLEAYGLVA